mmetsp:Transcript_125725/g.367372  ORF Transcript_125725/g.367372 Transcript_125725/m.367372 type:complete len:324 (-) Transcript_125725:1151-2122(-)
MVIRGLPGKRELVVEAGGACLCLVALLLCESMPFLQLPHLLTMSRIQQSLVRLHGLIKGLLCISQALLQCHGLQLREFALLVHGGILVRRLLCRLARCLLRVLQVLLEHVGLELGAIALRPGQLLLLLELGQLIRVTLVEQRLLPGRRRVDGLLRHHQLPPQLGGPLLGVVPLRVGLRPELLERAEVLHVGPLQGLPLLGDGLVRRPLRRPQELPQLRRVRLGRPPRDLGVVVLPLQGVELLAVRRGQARPLLGDRLLRRLLGGRQPVPELPRQRLRLQALGLLQGLLVLQVQVVAACGVVDLLQSPHGLLRGPLRHGQLPLQ